MSGENILIIVLDSCRYDAYVCADTPNMDSIGPPMCGYSQAANTMGSLFCYLHNEGPIVHRMSGNRIVTEYLLIPMAPKLTYLPAYYSKMGYYTIFLTGNPLIIRLRHAVKVHLFRGREYSWIGEAEQVVEDLPNIWREPFMAWLWLMDTHGPYYDGSTWCRPYPAYWDEVDLAEAYRMHVRSIEHVDRCVGRLLHALRGLENTTYVVVTADHGEAIGEWGVFPGGRARYYGHGLNILCEKLFEVPVVRGCIAGGGRGA